MNERIKELSEQAWEYAHLNARNLLTHSAFETYDKKFAELIIRECADIAREVGTNTVPEDFALDRCYEIERKIKEHFGVEE